MLACGVFGVKDGSLSLLGFCTKLCMWLSGALLAGSFLITATHYAWFDGLAGLGMAYLVYKEGRENWNGEECGCHGANSSEGSCQN